MVEVFKTNVDCPDKARNLIGQIHRIFPGYQVNFDLTDCDKILRVASPLEVESIHLINTLNQFGVQAEILSDEILS